MTTTHTLSRRDFLQATAAAGGGLMVGFALHGARVHAAEPAATTAAFRPNAFIRIAPNDEITVIVGTAEMGQGVLTALPQILAEDLEADWTKIRVESAPVDPAYNNPIFHMQGTFGSASVRGFWEPLRKAGATAREMLVAAAADTWGVEKSSCHARAGVVHHVGGKQLTYGDLVIRAASMPVPTQVTLKDVRDFKIIGREHRRLDTRQKIDGTARYGLDVSLSGMLTAVMAHPPTIGAKVAGFDAARTKAMRGVRHVVQLDDGVAVVADGFWSAKTGRDALDVRWTPGSNPDLSTARVSEALRARLAQPGLVAREEGVAAATGSAADIEAQYEVPYLAQACMEPMNCTASVTAERVDIWAPTQASGIVRSVVAQVLGIPPERVNVTTTLLGGGFGRRSALDFVIPAVQLSKAVGAPVKLVYTREDDMRAQHYRPAAVANLRGALDDAGRPARFEARLACPSVALAMRGSVTGMDDDAVDGLREWPYATPRVRVEWMQSEPGVLVWYWRSVGNSHNAFFTESFIDELAHAAKQDPYGYRVGLLADRPRHLGVLKRAASEAGWGTPLAKGMARGIAVHACFGSYVAEVVEASLRADGTPRVHRVVCAIDSGLIVNPAIVRQQMRGAIVFALSAALHGEITLDGGRVQQGNFDDYPVVRMGESPVIDVHIVSSVEAPGGAGEAGTPPLAPALANALFVLTGRRVRRLPIRPGDFGRDAA